MTCIADWFKPEWQEFIFENVLTRTVITARGSDMLLFEKVNHSTPRILDLSFMFLFFIIETGAKKMWPANEKYKCMEIDTLKNKWLKLRQDRRTFYWIKFLVKYFYFCFTSPIFFGTVSTYFKMRVISHYFVFKTSRICLI